MNKVSIEIKKIITICFLFSYNDVNAQSFTLNGTIVGKDTGIAVLNYVNANNKRCSDTATINQAKFQFSGSVKSVDYALLDIDPYYLGGANSNNRQLFIEPGIIYIVCKYGEIGNAEIKGSNTQTKSDFFA